MKKFIIGLVSTLFILIFAIFVFYNFTQKKAEGENCKTDQNCQSGLKCVMNVCSSGKPTSPCLSEKDCLEGLFCVKNKCSEVSEEIDGKLFRESFAFLRLAKATEMPTDRPPELQAIRIFSLRDYLCLEGEPLKDIKMAFEIYNPYDKVVIVSKEVPKEQKGGFRFIDCKPLPLGIVPGKKYEYKVYVEDKVVAIFPFEVIEK